MIAMSTVFTVVTATIMQLKMNTDNQKLVQLYEKIESDPNYPIIPSTLNTNELVDSEPTTNISRELHSSKLIQLLHHLLLMNTCLPDDHHLLNQTTLSKRNKNKLANITHFKSIIFFNYLTTANYTS